MLLFLIHLAFGNIQKVFSNALIKNIYISGQIMFFIFIVEN